MKLHSLFLYIIIAGFIIFGFFISTSFRTGPQLKNLVVDQNNGFVEIKGTIINSSFLSINDRQILPDKDDNFNTKIVLQNGYNLIKIYSKNNRDREFIKYVDLILNKH